MGKFEIVQNIFCASIPALKTSFALNLNEICPIDCVSLGSTQRSIQQQTTLETNIFINKYVVG